MNQKIRWTLFSLCLLSLDNGLQIACAQGFGRTKEELEQSSQKERALRPLKQISLFRPSERYKAEIPLPLKSLTYEQGTRLEFFRFLHVAGYFDSKGSTVRGNFKIPADGTYNLELLYCTKTSPSPFTVKIGNHTFNWATEFSYSFQPYTIGPLKLPAGECPLAIIQQKDQLSSLYLTSIRLLPAHIPSSPLVLRAESINIKADGPHCSSQDNVLVLKNFKDKKRGGFWVIDIPETGSYAVEVDYQSRLESPKDFVVSLPSNSTSIPWKAEPTQGRFMTKTVGVLQLDKGNCKIYLSAEEPVMESDFGILLLTLRPLSSQEAVAVKETLRQEAPASTVSSTPAPTPPPPARKNLDFGVAVFPELAKRPESENSLIAQDQFTEIYKTKTERLRNKYIATLKKLQQKYVQYQDFAAVAAIQEIIKNPNTPPKDTGLPNEAIRFAKAYEVQNNQLEEQIKQSYLQELRQLQAGFAEKQQFDQIAEIQKIVKNVEEKSPKELFTQQREKSSIRYLVGTWECIGKNNIRTSITINPDGQCTRLDDGQKPKAQWGWAFQVRKTGDNQFIFFSPSIKEILGRFHFVDDDTFDMPWHGSCLYKRKKE